MNNAFWTIRRKDFLYSALGIILTALGGAFVSEDFQSLLTNYTGEAMWGTILTLLVTGSIKHFRNKLVIKEEEQVSGMRSMNGEPKILI